MFKQLLYAVAMLCMGAMYLGFYLIYISDEWLIEPDKSSWVCTKNTIPATTSEKSACLQWTKVK